MSERPTLNGLQRDIDRVEGAQESHEKQCALRYGELTTAINELKDGQKEMRRLAIGILIAMVGWLAVQLWNDVNVQVDQAQAAEVKRDASPRQVTLGSE